MYKKSVVSLLVLGLAGCGAAPTNSDPHGGDAPRATGVTGETPVVDANASNSTIPPVASLYASNGNRIDFYDGGKEGILITELGESYTTPALKGMDVNALGAVNTWNQLSPAVPAPSALIELQARADAYVQAAGNVPAVDRPAAKTIGGSGPEASPITSSGDGVSVVQQAVNECNNGCCDASWLANSLCSFGGRYDWFDFNVGWSWVQNNFIVSVHETVCAGIGTSRFGVHRGDYINTFYVPEAHYQNYNWTAGIFEDSDNHSVVNTGSNNQPVAPTNMHTFCGSVEESG